MLQTLTTQRVHPRPTLIDVKGLGKPPVYNGQGDERAFTAWTVKVTNYVAGAFVDAPKILEWCREQAGTITYLALDSQFGSNADPADAIQDWEYILCQVRVILTQLTDKEPFDIVHNSGSDAVGGAEAWRRLNRRYDPSTSVMHIGLMNLCLQPGRVANLNDLPGALEKWDHNLHRLAAKRDPTGKSYDLPDHVKHGVLLGMLPSALADYVHLNITRLSTYKDLRDEIIRYYESKLGSATPLVGRNGPVPMDISALKGKGGKGQGKGKGKGKQQSKGKPSPTSAYQGYCSNCGRWGHRGIDCYSRGGQAARPAQQQPKGTPTKGKGKGKNKSKGKRKDAEHEQDDSQQPVEEQTWTENSEEAWWDQSGQPASEEYWEESGDQYVAQATEEYTEDDWYNYLCEGDHDQVQEDHHHHSMCC